MASKSACPYALGLFPILDAPWGARCGLSVGLRGQGMQLITRSLMIPRKLPQVVRPSVAPQAGGGNRSWLRSQSKNAAPLSRPNSTKRVASFFGDLLGPSQ
eukprot:6734753-Pyramimonas_sp.AAC.1